jgi:recombination protein RecA
MVQMLSVPELKLKLLKNKVAPPFKQAEFDILYGQGISNEGCIVDLAADNDIIQKSGAWYSYKDQRIAQGREKARDYLKANPAICKEIEQKVRDLTINKAW